MPFYDKSAYSSLLRAQHSDLAKVIFALAFTQDQSHIATATTTGQITLHSLPPEELTSTTVNLPNNPSVNALLTVDSNIYAATDEGLYLFDFNHPTKIRPLATGCVNALDQFDRYILAASSDAIFAVHSDGVQHIASLPPTAYPHCVATASSHTFLAGCDDGTLRTYDIRQTTPIETPISDATPRPYITSIALNVEKSFALIADSSNILTSIHLPTNSIVATTTAPFLPQALAFRDRQFYCGGSDSSTKALIRYDVSCNQLGTAPLSIDSVYAFACGSSGALAASGYCRNRKQLVDIYDNPPVRSFNLTV